MYSYLTRPLKKKIIDELKICFRHEFTQHRDIVENIRHKYSFKQRPQKGIVVTNVSSDPQRLSADNFVGTVQSHVMKASLEDYSGHSIEWVREDTRAIDRSQGKFPSPPGIYYIEMFSRDSLEAVLSESEFQDVLDSEGEWRYYFYVDPLLKSNREPLLKVADSTSPPDPQYVMNIPVLPNTIRVFANHRLLNTGHRLVLEGSPSLKVSSDGVSLGLSEGSVPVEVVTSDGPFVFDATINDRLVVEVNDQEVEIFFPDGILTAEEVAQTLRNGIYAHPEIGVTDFGVEAIDGRVRLSAVESLIFGDDLVSSANMTLGLDAGPVDAVLKGKIFHPYFEQDGTLALEVGEETYTIDFFAGEQRFDDIIDRIESASDGVTATIEKTGDYTFDPETGEVEFFRSFETGTRLTATYKYPLESKGPFGIRKEHSNNSAIDGVTLAFGSRIVDGDKLAIVVHENRLPTAKEYGGRWDVGVDLDIITRDPATRDELGEMVQLYFFGIRKERLTEEGLELTDISFGGDSEEVYDDNDNSYYYNSSISMTFQTDWAIHMPMPLTIERVTPTSFEEDARVAGTDEEADSDLLKPVEGDTLTLERIKKIYGDGKNSNYVKVQ